MAEASEQLDLGNMHTASGETRIALIACTSLRCAAAPSHDRIHIKCSSMLGEMITYGTASID